MMRDTAIDRIPDLDVGEAEEVAEESAVSVAGSVSGVEIKAAIKCSICGSRQHALDRSSRFGRCDGCHMLQKRETFHRELRGTLKVKGNDGAEYRLTAVFGAAPPNGNGRKQHRGELAG